MSAFFKKFTELKEDSLLKNAAYLFGVLVVSSLAGFITWAITARLYNQEDVGIATSVLSIAQLISLTATLGLGTGLVRFLSTAGNPAQMVNTTFTVTGTASVILSLGYLMGIKLWAPSLHSLSQNPLYTIGFIFFVLFLALATLVQQVFQACRESRFAFWQVLAAGLLRLVFSVLLIPMGSMGILLAVLISTFLAMTGSSLLFLPKVIENYRWRPALSMPVFKQLIPYSIGAHLAGVVAQAPILYTPSLLLESMGAQSSAAAYLSMMIGSMIGMPGQALAVSAFAESSAPVAERKSIFTRSTRISLVITVALALLSALFAPWILSIFGKTYATEGAPLIYWFAFAAPIASLNKLGFSVFQVQKRIITLFSLNLVSTVAYFLSMYLMLSRWDLQAVGFGWLVAQAAFALLFFGDMIKKGKPGKS